MGAFFSRKGAVPFEKELEKIEEQLTNLEVRREETHANQRRYLSSLVFYSILIEVGLVVWYYFHKKPKAVLDQAIHASVLVIFPIFVFLLKKCVVFYYRRRILNDEIRLTKLRNALKFKLDDRKRATEFESTQNLLKRYGKLLDSPGAEKDKKTPGKSHGNSTPSSAGRQPNLGTPANSRPAPTTPVSTFSPNYAQSSTPQKPAGQNFANQITPPIPSYTTPANQVSAPKGWMNKLVDYLVGDGPKHGYALICSNCYQHNGFAPAGEEDMQFRCRNCSFLNQRGKTATPPVTFSQLQREPASNRNPSPIPESNPTLVPSNQDESLGSNTIMPEGQGVVRPGLSSPSRRIPPPVR